MLQNKNILIGITGGISAYKIPMLVRSFIKQGANVKVVMTTAAEEFVSKKVLSVLSQNEVYATFFNHKNEWNNHVHLANWADVFVIAPLTANSLAKLAHGLCGNILTATYLSCKAPVCIAPAMDLEMYEHPTTKENLTKLQQHGVHIMPSEYGDLASGLIGYGRMPEPERIAKYIITNILKQTLPLLNKKVLINAGPTYEKIDPVRFIGNHSSGKMGIAIAETFAKLGASVTLVLGPTNETVKNTSIKVIPITTAQEMFEYCKTYFINSDITILAAAVADFKPKTASEQKIKKNNFNNTIELTHTVDIAKELGNIKTNQILVGFALETNDLEKNGIEKLNNKNLDFIVLNAANNTKTGFGVDTNQITIIDKFGKKTPYKLKAKTEVAEDITSYVLQIMSNKK